MGDIMFGVLKSLDYFSIRGILLSQTFSDMLTYTTIHKFIEWFYEKDFEMQNENCMTYI